MLSGWINSQTDKASDHLKSEFMMQRVTCFFLGCPGSGMLFLTIPRTHLLSHLIFCWGQCGMHSGVNPKSGHFPNVQTLQIYIGLWKVWGLRSTWCPRVLRATSSSWGISPQLHRRVLVTGCHAPTPIEFSDPPVHLRTLLQQYCEVLLAETKAQSSHVT